MSTTARKSWIDLVRAIGIFAIVYGHMVQGDSVVSRFFGSFRVAIFFAVMGLTFRYRRGIVGFLKKKALRLLVPYFAFALVSILIMAVIGRVYPAAVQGQPTSILKNLGGALYGNGLKGNMKWNLPLWFLPCSFVTLLIVYLAESLIARARAERRDALRLVFFAVTVAAAVAYVAFLKRQRLPFGAEVAIPMSGFVELGILLKKTEGLLSRRAAGAVGLVLLLAGFFLSLRNGDVSVVSLNFGGSIALYYVTALVCIVGTMLLSQAVCASATLGPVRRNFVFCGAHTLAILCMHKFPVLLFQLVVPYTKQLLRAPADSLLKNLVGFVLTFVVIALCLIVEKPIARSCPVVLGQSRVRAEARQ